MSCGCKIGFDFTGTDEQHTRYEPVVDDFACDSSRLRALSRTLCERLREIEAGMGGPVSTRRGGVPYKYADELAALERELGEKS